MFIKLCLEEGKFQVFRSEDIISIAPCWYTEDCFDCYHLCLLGQQQPLELTEKQADRLVNILECRTILADVAI